MSRTCLPGNNPRDEEGEIDREREKEKGREKERGRDKERERESFKVTDAKYKSTEK